MKCGEWAAANQGEFQGADLSDVQLSLVYISDVNLADPDFITGWEHDAPSSRAVRAGGEGAADHVRTVKRACSGSQKSIISVT